MSHFNLQWEIKPLALKEVFTISRGSRTHVHNVFVRLTKDEVTGLGEASPNTRYEETPESVVEELESFDIKVLDSLDHPEDVQDALNAFGFTNQSAKVAVEMAWLDWWAKSQGQPLWKLWGAASPIGPVTSYTIGIDKLSVMQAKIKKADKYPLYKVKLGTAHDRDIIRAIREVTDKPIRVDANEGWTSISQALDEIKFLESFNVEMIEQPMHASMKSELKVLKQESPLPLCADESFTGLENLDEIAASFHIINIKLMKIGSVIKARQVIEKAHQRGLKVMIGCMIESSLANAAGALVSLWADYADLDGHVLISNDPFSGLTILKDGKITLSDQPGLGILD